MDETIEEENPSQSVRGVPKSGRIWKTTMERKFSKIKKDKPFNSNWEKKKLLKNETGVVKALAQEIREERQRERREKREKLEAKRKRQLENQRKAEIVQVIKNTRKLKRLKKKQLRMIEKRDVSDIKNELLQKLNK